MAIWKKSPISPASKYHIRFVFLFLRVTSLMSSMFQSLSVIPAAIAGVTRNVLHQPQVRNGVGDQFSGAMFLEIVVSGRRDHRSVVGAQFN